MRNNRGGFTIIESMIFLAISGLMFSSAILVFRGQQQSSQFNQSMRQLDSYISDIINDTQTGVFPDVDASCEYTGSNVSFDLSGEVSNDCIFLGKITQLGVGPPGSDLEPRLLTYTVVGENPGSSASTNRDSFSFQDVNPAVYADSTFDTTENFDINWGSSVTSAFYKDKSGTVVYVRGIGVLYSSFGQFTRANSVSSGEADISLYAVTATAGASSNASSFRQAPDVFRSSISANSSNNTYVLLSAEEVSSPLTLCIEGAGGRQASVEIGSDKGSIVTTTNFQPPVECV